MDDVDGGLQVHESPPPGWDALCVEAGSLFQGSAWHDVLQQGLGAIAAYVTRGNDPLTSISIFRAGPFRIGYVGFPVGRTFGAKHAGRVLAANAAILRECLSIDSLRIPASGFGGAGDLGLRFVGLPETAIVDLQSWSEAALSESARRNVRKAVREGVVADDATAEDADAIWKLYRGTIEAHGGLLRHRAPYFHVLVNLACDNPRLRVRVARFEGAVVAYFATVFEGREAIYLHGGFDRRRSALRPSDLLYFDAITQARQAACLSFNFLSSPADQPELVRYKEKWGGQTAEERVYSLDLRPARAFMFDQALRLYRRVGRMVGT